MQTGLRGEGVRCSSCVARPDRYGASRTCRILYLHLPTRVGIAASLGRASRARGRAPSHCRIVYTVSPPCIDIKLDAAEYSSGASTMILCRWGILVGLSYQQLFAVSKENSEHIEDCAELHALREVDKTFCALVTPRAFRTIYVTIDSRLLEVCRNCQNTSECQLGADASLE
ncbi:hypothetical protein BKA93DRAFT_323977 [Sparassis latifolia]